MSTNTNLLDEPRKLDGKKTFPIQSADTSFSLGSPVMLHGLKKRLPISMVKLEIFKSIVSRLIVMCSIWMAKV